MLNKTTTNKRKNKKSIGLEFKLLQNKKYCCKNKTSSESLLNKIKINYSSSSSSSTTNNKIQQDFFENNNTKPLTKQVETLTKLSSEKISNNIITPIDVVVKKTESLSKKIDMLKFACLESSCIIALRTYIQKCGKNLNQCLTLLGPSGVGKYFVVKLLAEQLHYKIINFSIKDLFEEEEKSFVYNNTKINNNNNNNTHDNSLEEKEEFFLENIKKKNYKKTILHLKTIFNNFGFLNFGQKTFLVIRDLDFIFENYFSLTNTDNKTFKNNSTEIEEFFKWIIDEFVENKHYAHNKLQIPIFIFKNQSNYYIRKFVKHPKIDRIDFYPTNYNERMNWLLYLNKNINYNTFEIDYATTNNIITTNDVNKSFLQLINFNLLNNQKKIEEYIKQCCKYDGGDIRNMIIKIFYWFGKEKELNNLIIIDKQQLLEEKHDLLKSIYILNIFEFCKYIFIGLPELLIKYDNVVDKTLNIIIERIKEMKMWNMIEYNHKKIFSEYLYTKNYNENKQSILSNTYDTYSKLDLLNLKNEWNEYGHLQLENYKNFILIEQLTFDINNNKNIKTYLKNYESNNSSFNWISSSNKIQKQQYDKKNKLEYSKDYLGYYKLINPINIVES